MSVFAQVKSVAILNTVTESRLEQFPSSLSPDIGWAGNAMAVHVARWGD